MTADKPDTLRINEIFHSIQGESTFAGRPCVFIRLTYCNLRCTFCDTEYAFFEGAEMSVAAIMEQVEKYNCQLVEVTGGEPLIQKNVHRLMSELCDRGYEVLLETAGHMDISLVDSRVRRIMDIKCPSSGESEKVMWKNLDYIMDRDELKFVIGDREDFDWAVNVIQMHHLKEKCALLISPVFGKMENEELAGWVLESGLNMRMQLQMHKYIWDPARKGV